MKRQRERARQEKRKEKAARKAARSAKRRERGDAQVVDVGVDPDIADIVPGPQPLPWEEDEQEPDSD
jgi:hypothetical protein